MSEDLLLLSKGRKVVMNGDFFLSPVVPLAAGQSRSTGSFYCKVGSVGGDFSFYSAECLFVFFALHCLAYTK